MAVRFRAELNGNPLGEIVRDFGRLSVAAIDAGMEGVAAGLVLELRQEIGAAFPTSRRMPTTVTGRYYPAADGKPPAVLIHPRKGSNAGWILGAHKGGVIRAKESGTALAIPTKHVPRAARGGRRMTPDEVSKHFGERLDLMPARGGGKAMGYLVLRKQTIGRSGRVRRATEGRARQGRTARPIVMFILVPAVTLPQRLRPEETVRQWLDLAPRQIEQAARRLGVG
ncbi:DUF6441 family protein [Synechococcus phage MinM1]|nr:DUF6441 family protein [Synechococcus phage MinM1]